jgi:hypothetical protein
VVWRRPPRPHEDRKERRHDPRGAFVLGVITWTPSLAYLAALKLIADASAPALQTALASLILVARVLLVIEVPGAFGLSVDGRQHRTVFRRLNGLRRQGGSQVPPSGLRALGAA